MPQNDLQDLYNELMNDDPLKLLHTELSESTMEQPRIEANKNIDPLRALYSELSTPIQTQQIVSPKTLQTQTPSIEQIGAITEQFQPSQAPESILTADEEKQPQQTEQEWKKSILQEQEQTQKELKEVKLTPAKDSATEKDILDWSAKNSIKRMVADVAPFIAGGIVGKGASKIAPILTKHPIVRNVVGKTVSSFYAKYLPSAAGALTTIGTASAFNQLEETGEIDWLKLYKDTVPAAGGLALVGTAGRMAINKGVDIARTNTFTIDKELALEIGARGTNAEAQKLGKLLGTDLNKTLKSAFKGDPVKVKIPYKKVTKYIFDSTKGVKVKKTFLVPEKIQILEKQPFWKKVKDLFVIEAPEVAVPLVKPEIRGKLPPPAEKEAEVMRITPKEPTPIKPPTKSPVLAPKAPIEPLIPKTKGKVPIKEVRVGKEVLKPQDTITIDNKKVLFNGNQLGTKGELVSHEFTILEKGKETTISVTPKELETQSVEQVLQKRVPEKIAEFKKPEVKYTAKDRKGAIEKYQKLLPKDAPKIQLKEDLGKLEGRYNKQTGEIEILKRGHKDLLNRATAHEVAHTLFSHIGGKVGAVISKEISFDKEGNRALKLSIDKEGKSELLTAAKLIKSMWGKPISYHLKTEKGKAKDWTDNDFAHEVIADAWAYKQVGGRLEAAARKTNPAAMKLVDELFKGKALVSKAEVKPTKKGEAGEVYVPTREELQEVTKKIKSISKIPLTILEPSKLVERGLGKEPYATVIKGIHHPEAKQLEFYYKKLDEMNKTVEELEQWFDKFPKKDLENLMLSRGKAYYGKAKILQKEAQQKLNIELANKTIQNSIKEISDYNYDYLTKIMKGQKNINYVKDYFYGLYENQEKVDRFLENWMTTKRFTKEKVFPTYADAKSFGLKLKTNNPITNLKQEYAAIARLEGIEIMRNNLLASGGNKYISKVKDAPVDWKPIKNEPLFDGYRLEPTLAKLVNNLLATNKITSFKIDLGELEVKPGELLRQINNSLRTIKFVMSGFHALSILKQSVADSGYFGFLHKKTALRGFTRGFKKNDPIFKTEAYKDYIKHGGGHRYSVESQSMEIINKMTAKINKNANIGTKIGMLPINIPLGFVNWMFNKYIPKVKFAKYADVVAEKELKLGRLLKSSEKIDIIKEQQNFYGMMNERLFGRSGTFTTAMRFYFLSPGYAEGNYRTMIKAATQWGGKGGEGFRASRSRSNIVNSLLITTMLSTIGTLILTGKAPKKPETLEDVRDLMKIDTGKVDDKGRRIMIDMATYDKDYWNIAFNVLKGKPVKAVDEAIRRIGGMKAPSADLMWDLAGIAMGKKIYDWKGDKIVEITDKPLEKLMKIAIHEIKKIEPISFSVYKQARRKGIDRFIATLETLAGVRTTKTEKDKREQQIISRIYSLKGQQEELYLYLKDTNKPYEMIQKYNDKVRNILESDMVPEKMKKEWEPKLRVDVNRLLGNKGIKLTSPNTKQKDIDAMVKYLKNFGMTKEQTWDMVQNQMIYRAKKKRQRVRRKTLRDRYQRLNARWK